MLNLFLLKSYIKQLIFESEYESYDKLLFNDEALDDTKETVILNKDAKKQIKKWIKQMGLK